MLIRLVIVAATILGLLAVPHGLLAQGDKDLKKLNDKIELLEAKLKLLEKENDLLKRENELLKRELDLAKTDGGKKLDIAKKARPITSAGGIDYELTDVRVNGRSWEMKLLLTSADADKITRVEKTVSITEEGKTFNRKLPFMKSISVPLGQKIQFKVDLGPIPDSVTKLSTVELHCVGKGGVSNVVVFKNVTIGP